MSHYFFFLYKSRIEIHLFLEKVIRMNEEYRKENIKYFRNIYKSSNEIETIAYEVYPNIWVIPSRYLPESLNDLLEMNEPAQFGVYNKKYLNTDTEKREFLGAVKKAIDEITKRPFGNALLRLVSGAVPLPEDTKASNTTLSCLENGIHTHDVVANVVIWGSGNNLNDNKIYSRSIEDAGNGNGTTTEILWNPYLTMKNSGNNNIQSPVDNLILLLTRSVYRLYGLGLDRIRYPFFKLENENSFYHATVEELLIYGASFNMIHLQPYYFFKNGFIDMKKKYQNAKAKIDNIRVNDEYSQLLELKYHFDFEDIIGIQTNKMCTNVFPNKSQCNEIGNYFVDPDDLIDTSTSNKPLGLFTSPTRKIIYGPNLDQVYDEYEPVGYENTDFFRNFTFPENADFFDQYEFLDNILTKIPEEMGAFIPKINNKEKVSSISLVEEKIEPVFTKKEVVDKPTLELAISAVKINSTSKSTKFTTKIEDALKDSDQCFGFDSILLNFINEKQSLSTEDMYKILSMIKIEILSEIEATDVDEYDWNDIRWINHVVKEIFGQTIKRLILNDQIEDAFSIHYNLVVPKKVPSKLLQLRPYLFYQWYVGRFTRFIRIESMFYQLLDCHVKSLIKIIASKAKDSIHAQFYNETEKIVDIAQKKLSELFRNIAYEDMKKQIFDVIEPLNVVEGQMNELIYNKLEYLKNIDATNKMELPKLNVKNDFFMDDEGKAWVGNQLLKLKGDISEVNDSPDDNISYLFEEDTELEGTFNYRFLHEVFSTRLILKINEETKLEINLFDLSVVITNHQIQVIQNDKELFVQTFNELKGWHELECLTDGKSFEFFDRSYNNLLASISIESNRNNFSEKNKIIFKNKSEELIIHSLRFSLMSLISSEERTKIFDNEFLYTQDNDLVISGHRYQLKSAVFDDEGRLSIRRGEFPFYDTDSNGNIELDVIFEQGSKGKKIRIDKPVYVKVPDAIKNYFGVSREGELKYVDKNEATRFIITDAKIKESEIRGFILQTEDENFVCVNSRNNPNEDFILSTKTDFYRPEKFKSTYIFNENDATSMFYLK